jgi:predicted molibdopterin-dependent oxidoreductase YjgC
MTRYEQPGGGTETTTERRVVLSPEIPGPRAGEARAEWAIFAELARRSYPERAHLVGLESAERIRAEIASIVPAYAGIERLERGGDPFQWGGPRLCDGWRFSTPDGRAHFSTAMPAAAIAVAHGQFRLSTRRGKQFNSMVWQGRDPLTGAGRDALFISAGDARGLGLGEGDPVVVRGERGVEVRARAHLARIRAGNVQMFWPEANALIAGGRRDQVSGVPDYNATVELARA